MMKIVLLCVLVVIVSANPRRSLKVQETAHEIARSVKASSEYSLEEKEEILSNLKAINKDAKEFTSAHGHKKQELKKDLHTKLAALKTEMHNDKGLEEDQRELEETKAKKQVSTIHEDLKAVQAEVKAAHLKGTQKKQAKKLLRVLEEGYSNLASQTNKNGRKEAARAMQTAATKLKEFMQPEATLEAKKEKIMGLVRSAEEEYSGKDLSSSAKKQIHTAFEEMKSDLNSESDVHALKTMLKSKVEAVKKLESASHKDKEAEKEADDDDDFEEGSEKEVEHKDFEEADSEDESNKLVSLEESVSGDEE